LVILSCSSDESELLASAAGALAEVASVVDEMHCGLLRKLR